MRTTRNEWMFFILVNAVFAVALFAAPSAKPAPTHTAQASYYTLWGNRTSCGKTASSNAWFVASLKADTAKCGLKVRICKGTRCVNTTVQDRGAWRGDSRRWDLQTRVKTALRCSDLCSVRWQYGW